MGFFDKLKDATTSHFNSLLDEAKNNLKPSRPDVQKNADEDTYIPPYRTAAYQDTPPAPTAAPAPAPTAAPAPAPTPVAEQPSAPAGEGMYDSALEKLIDVALADGELTEKEKQVLFRRAESMGVDLDEFEMVLEARLFEKKRADAASAPAPTVAPTAAPTSNKFGDVKKCPVCGAIVQSFNAKCVECGYEFMNAEANQGIQRLFEMLSDVDNQNVSTGKEGFWGMIASEQKESNIINRKSTIIRNFPIPTTKNDMLEFLALAAPQAKVSFWSNDANDARMLAPAWKSKCEQVIIKAKFALKDDKEALEEMAKYAKQLKINF